MLKLLLLTSVAVLGSVLEDDLNTAWLSVLVPRTNDSSSATVDSPLCSKWLNITRRNNAFCTCGTVRSPLLEVSFPDGTQELYPLIAVNTEEEIQTAIKRTSCECSDGAINRILIGKRLEPNFAFFASCESNPADENSVGCWPEIVAKTPPTLAKLREVINSTAYINHDWKMTCYKA